MNDPGCGPARLGHAKEDPMLFSRRGPGRVTVTEAHQAVQEGTALLLDVREAAEWQAGHVPGALHLPLSQLAAGAVVPAVDPGTRLMVICRSGRRSRAAARLLSQRGCEAVDVIGGTQQWTRHGLPIKDARGAAGVVI
jgi:rhodanese-related sulfurtransferase